MAGQSDQLAYIMVTLEVYREGDQFVSSCLELGTASCGDTEQEALHNVVEATELYLDVLRDHGQLERTLGEKGVQVQQHQATGPRVVCPQGRHVHPAVFTLSTGPAAAPTRRIADGGVPWGTPS